jgi:tetratricopeptide (TPR) repeat protein
MGLGYAPTAAVMQVLESWLWFQRDRSREAAPILRSAEETLRDTDDYITLGNIQSAFGRMARRVGRYDEALRLFQNAIDFYNRRDPRHRNLARSLANMAQVERLLAVDVRGRIDAEVERRRKTAGKSSVTASRGRFEQLRKQCFAHLEQAAAIYRLHDHHHGSGTVLVISGIFTWMPATWTAPASKPPRLTSLASRRTTPS